ncbi:YadA-like family protein, partial [Fusobacterium sp.]|uniref:YadA-like family protein n=1 Tax=Fusobacterium sp. TaxID=68766 RepID=UPI0025BF8693
KATTTDTAKVATVGDIVNTINNTYWIVNSTANTDGEGTYTKNDESNINAGETLNINADKNIKITGSGNTLNVATKDNVTFNNVTTNNLTATGNTTVKNFNVTTGSTIDMGNNVITNVASGGDIDTNVANIGDVKNIAAKSVEKVVLDESVTDNIATINTASKKSAGEAGETYKVGVSRKAVQDAAKEIIDVVGTDPISVTPTTNDTTGKKTFTVTYNGENAATSTPLTYKANGGNNQTVMLSKGLDFTNGNYTTASIADNGVVKYDVTIGEITQGTDGKPGTNGKDGLVTTETLIKTLGNTGWNANAAANGGTLDGNATKTLVKPGDEVIFAAGKNLIVKQTIENGKQTYTYSLNKEISDISKVTVGEKGADGQNGVDGAIGVNGKDGSSVVINGKDGSIGLNGKDGSNGLTVKGDKGADGVDGANGTNGKTRIVYEYKDPNDPNNTIKEEVATLNDGMKYAGDDAQGADKAKVITKKLNETVDIMGGADKNKLTENNIGVNNVDGKLKVQLAKEINLGTDGSLTTGKTKVDTNGITITKADGAIAGDVKLTNTGLDNGGNKIVNVAKGEKDTDAVNVSQLKEYSNAITNTGLNFAANSGNNIHKNLGETLTIKGTGTKADELYSSENIKTKTNNDGFLEIMLDKDLKSNSITVGEKGEPGKDGVDGKIVVTDNNGKETVVINGKDGSIGLTGPKGADGKDASATISVKDGTKGLDGNNGKDGESKTRIVYKKPDGNTEEVATLNDGLKFKGDTDTVISKKLNQTLEIIGGADKDKLTDKNIGVIEKDGKLEVKLAKNINLGNDGTITAGNTVINNSGITINNNADGAKTVSLTNNGLNNGGNKITNVAPGEVSSTSKDAINGSQLYSVKTEAAKHTTVSVDGGNKGLADGKANANLILTETTNDAGGKHFDIKLSDKVTLGNATDKQITVDGETGTISIGDNTTISNGNAKFDKVKVNGIEGTITGLTNKEWIIGKTEAVSGRAATEDQLKTVETGLNSKITNINSDLIKKGLNFAGNSGEVHKNLGDKFAIKGSGTKADEQYSSENIKTKIDKDGNLEIMLDKDLKANNITVGEKGADGKDGVDGTIGVNGKDGSSVVINGKDGTIGLTGPKGADGKDGASANISVKDGSKGLDGNNGKDGESKTRIVYETKNPDGTKSTEEVATLNDGLNFMGDIGDKAAVKLNKQVNIVGGQADNTKLSDGANIGVVSSQNGENGKLEIKLAKDLAGISSITLVGGKDKDGNDQKVTINVSKDGALDIGGKKLTGIADGEVSETSRDAVNGSQLHQVKQDIGDVINNHAAAINNNSKRIDKLDGRINSGLANSAAMSTLEFQEMGINQAVVGAAIGTYRGNQAVAVGIQGAPTENIRVQAKVSVAPGSSGGADAMAGIGASWKFNLK